MLGYSEGTGQPSGTAHRVAAFHPDWKGQRAGSQRGPRFQHAHSPAQAPCTLPAALLRGAGAWYLWWL